MKPSMNRWLVRVAGRIVPPLGCATCRGWTGNVLEGEDGPHRPETCPECGRMVPATLVVELVGVAIAEL